MMPDKMQIEKIVNLNKQLNEDIGKLQIKNDVLLAENNLLQKENEKLKSELRGKENEINYLKALVKALVDYLRQFRPNKEEITTQS